MVTISYYLAEKDRETILSSIMHNLTRYVAGLCLLLAITGCSRSSEETMDWGHVDYARISCEVNPNASGCSQEDKDLNAERSAHHHHGHGKK